jgi:RNA polymerase sigma factor (sigma-70 family)
MTKGMKNALHDVLVERYAGFKKRLAYFLGSEDVAADALHETWLRVGAIDDDRPLKNPGGYLFRMAMNIAADQHRKNSRLLNQVEVEDIERVVDELADPARIVAGRHEMNALEDAMRQLTPRRREILIAARVQGMLNRQIAELFGISLRQVEKELRAALLHCEASLDRKVVRRRGPSARDDRHE